MSLYSANLNMAILSGARLVRAYLERARLTGAIFEEHSSLERLSP